MKRKQPTLGQIRQEIARIVYDWAYQNDIVFLPVDSEDEAMNTIIDRLFSWFKERHNVK